LRWGRGINSQPGITEGTLSSAGRKNPFKKGSETEEVRGLTIVTADKRNELKDEWFKVEIEGYKFRGEKGLGGFLPRRPMKNTT